MTFRNYNLIKSVKKSRETSSQVQLSNRNSRMCPRLRVSESPATEDKAHKALALIGGRVNFGRTYGNICLKRSIRISNKFFVITKERNN